MSQVLHQYPPRHPLRAVHRGLTAWLVIFALVMVTNAIGANDILLGGFQPVPFFVVGGIALLWSINLWNPICTIACSTSISVGVALRGLEVLIYSDYSPGGKITGATLWMLTGATATIFGLINLVAISRLRAEQATN